MRIDLTLQPAGVAETLEVLGESPLIAIGQSARATSLRDAEIEKMPRGRDFTSLATQVAGTNAERKSFRHSLLLVRTFLLVTAWASNPANLPRRPEDLHNEVALLVLPERRRQRSYPRAVKVKMSNYALNRRKRRG